MMDMAVLQNNLLWILKFEVHVILMCHKIVFLTLSSIISCKNHNLVGYTKRAQVFADPMTPRLGGYLQAWVLTNACP